jgi:hypothetical protein
MRSISVAVSATSLLFLHLISESIGSAPNHETAQRRLRFDHHRDSLRHRNPATPGKKKRQAEPIEQGYERRGVAKRRVWATVNKETGGANKSGSGCGKPIAGDATALREKRPRRLANAMPQRNPGRASPPRERRRGKDSRPQLADIAAFVQYSSEARIARTAR